MRRAAVLVGALVVLAAITGGVFIKTAIAGSKPAVQLNVDRAAPREVDDAVQQAIVRDYSAAWQSLNTALANNDTGALKDNFIGFALDKLTERVNDQQRAGLRTRLVDRGHKVEAIFYSLDGSAMELHDQATLETEILDGNTVIHSERAEIQYYVVMTGAEDRWKVRVLESAAGRP
jgi:hypothetical protein